MAIFNIDLSETLPLLMYIGGIVLFSAFIYLFYRTLSKRDLVGLDLHQYNTANHPGLKKVISIVLYGFEYIVFFPLLSFIWFSVLALFMLLLSENQSLNQILIMSFAVVASVRICSYFNEDLAKDLAKIIPFSMLGIFLLDSSFFSFNIIDKFSEVPLFFETILSYFTLVILLEFLVRIPYSIISLMTKEEIGEDINNGNN